MLAADVALRKRKSADAQAAFRKKRANYISTLKEAVTSLESVIIQLQQSCRGSRTEVQDLQQQNARLHFDCQEREAYWRTLWCPILKVLLASLSFSILTGEAMGLVRWSSMT
ncbi:hypothetical protein EST38_g10373 [Candolleomyces aberdarensis]|uniref:BZIP domain-containing protein n=1 Tax=Candolleomyces aberdarensis TaxID=2316362 RepID=A0A4Q2D885_9AGAR|nr:hypothetical protein EST38_g10373 [Candolleomyces aberdarensis]